MKHFTVASFWQTYNKLPQNIQNFSDKKFELLKENPKHPSLHFKQLSKYWSVRVGLYYRSLGVEVDEGIVWFWIGNHGEYDRLIK